MLKVLDIDIEKIFYNEKYKFLGRSNILKKNHFLNSFILNIILVCPPAMAEQRTDAAITPSTTALHSIIIQSDRWPVTFAIGAHETQDGQPDDDTPPKTVFQTLLSADSRPPRFVLVEGRTYAFAAIGDGEVSISVEPVGETAAILPAKWDEAVPVIPGQPLLFDASGKAEGQLALPAFDGYATVEAVGEPGTTPTLWFEVDGSWRVRGTATHVGPFSIAEQIADVSIQSGKSPTGVVALVATANGFGALDEREGEAPRPLSTEAQVSGLLTLGDEDVWIVEANAGDGPQDFELRHPRTEVPPTLELRALGEDDRLGEVLAVAPPGRRGRIELESVNLPAGRHALVVKAARETRLARYDLSRSPGKSVAENAEQEPNGTFDLATVFAPEQLVTGELHASDSDVWRIEIPTANERWRIVASGGVKTIALFEENGMELANATGGQRGARVDEITLLPGPHLVRVEGDGAYTLRALALGPQPDDFEREPNNTPELAGRLRFGEPANGILRVGDSVDNWRMPLTRTRTLRIEVDPPGLGDLSVTLSRNGERVVRGSTAPGAPFIHEGEFDAGEWLIALTPGRRNDADRYQIRVGTPAAAADNSLDLTFTTQPPVLAAFSPHGQRFEVTARVTNSAPTLTAIDLASFAPGRMWRVEGLPSQVELGPSETRDVSFEVVARDRLTGLEDAVLELRARPKSEQDTVWSIAHLPITVSEGAEPIGAHVFFDTPEALRGGINAADKHLGGSIVANGTDTIDDVWPEVSYWRDWNLSGFYEAGGFGNRNWQSIELIDGYAPLDRAHSRFGQPTIRLAGDDPIPISGLAISLRSNSDPIRGLRDYRIEASIDGKSFTPVSEGRLEAIEDRQHIVFDEPVSARFIRIVNRACDPGTACSGHIQEVQAIMPPGLMPTGFETPDLADLLLGARIFSADRKLGGQHSHWERRMLVPGENFSIATAERNTPTRAKWLLGFKDGRAALVERIVWSGPVDTEAKGHPERIEVAGNADGAIETLEPLGTLLRPATGDNSEIRFDPPRWLRVIAFSVDDPEPAFKMPDRLSVIEAAATPERPSILGLWDEMSSVGPFELSNPAVAPLPEGEGATASETATLLPFDEPKQSVVERGAREEWWRIDIPEDGDGLLRLQFFSLRMVEAELELVGPDGTSVPLAPIEELAADLPELFPTSEDGTPVEDVARPSDRPRHRDLVARVTPGESYRLRIHEGPPSLTIFREISNEITLAMPAYRRALLGLASEMGDDDAVSGSGLGRFADDDGWVTGPLDLMRSIVSAPLNASGTPVFEEALGREIDRLAARSGAKGVFFMGSGTGINMPFGKPFETARPRVDAVLTECNGFFCDTKQLAQLDLERLTSLGGGTLVQNDGPLQVEEAFMRAHQELRRPKTHMLTASWLRLAQELLPEPAPEPGPMQKRLSIVQIASESTADAVLDDDRPSEADSTVGPRSELTAVGIIIDASGSMLQRLDGERRIEIAKSALTELVVHGLDIGQPVAMTAFGYQENACEIRTIKSLAPLDPVDAATAVATIQSINRSKTPIAAALADMADQLTAHEGPQRIVLITDGEETCEGDVAATITDLRSQGYDVTVNIVGFAIDDPVLKSQFYEWSVLGGGRYFDARNADELASSLQSSTAPLARPVVEARFELWVDGAEFARDLAPGVSVDINGDDALIVQRSVEMATPLDFLLHPHLVAEIGPDGRLQRIRPAEPSETLP